MPQAKAPAWRPVCPSLPLCGGERYFPSGTLRQPASHRHITASHSSGFPCSKVQGPGGVLCVQTAHGLRFTGKASAPTAAGAPMLDACTATGGEGN